MSANTITATMRGSQRGPESVGWGVDLANHFAAMRKSLELTKRAKISGSLLLTAVAALLGYGYLGPTLSDVTLRPHSSFSPGCPIPSSGAVRPAQLTQSRCRAHGEANIVARPNSSTVGR